MVPVIIALNHRVDRDLIFRSNQPVAFIPPFLGGPAIEDVFGVSMHVSSFAWISRLPLNARADHPLLLKKAADAAHGIAVAALKDLDDAEIAGHGWFAGGARLNVEAQVIDGGGRPFILIDIDDIPATPFRANTAALAEWAKTVAQPALSRAFSCEVFPLTGLETTAGGDQRHKISHDWGNFLFNERDRSSRPAPAPEPEPFARARAFFEAEEIATAVRDGANANTGDAEASLEAPAGLADGATKPPAPRKVRSL